MMKVNALLMNAADNVVTTVAEIAKGKEVVYEKDGEFLTLKAEEDIPYCHKMALVDLPEACEVIKYGESLGRTATNIGKGCWVNDQNLKSELRDYDSELAADDWQMCAIQSAHQQRKTFQFWGYRRAEGRPGIRNQILILPTCVCASESCRIVASQIRGAVNIVFNTGCSDVQANTDMSQKVLTGFACHPNVYGVVIIGLGCIRKGGTRPIVEVLQQAIRPSRKGAVVMDTAGFDIASVTSMVASGCQAIVFTTGRGTPTGNAIAPVLKVTANERTYHMMEDNMDVDLSAVLRGEKTIAQMGSELVDIVAEVASGRMTKAEAFGFSDIAVDHVCRFV